MHFLILKHSLPTQTFRIPLNTCYLKEQHAFIPPITLRAILFYINFERYKQQTDFFFSSGKQIRPQRIHNVKITSYLHTSYPSPFSRDNHCYQFGVKQRRTWITLKVCFLHRLYIICIPIKYVLEFPSIFTLTITVIFYIFSNVMRKNIHILFCIFLVANEVNRIVYWTY